MMDALERATYMNNEGVTALGQGEATVAVNILTNSIKMMKQSLLSMNAENGVAPVPKPRPLPVESCPTMGAEGGISARTIDVPRMEFSGSAPLVSTINSAIVIPTDTTTKFLLQDRNGSLAHIYSTIAICNLALAHHHQYQQASRHPVASFSTCFKTSTVTKQHDRDVLVGKVEKLYTCALRLCGETDGLDLCQQFQRMKLLVQLASLNNLSQLRYSEGDYGFAAECMRSVGQYIMQNAPSISSAMDYLGESKVQSLLLNVWFLQAKSLAASAA